MEWIYFVVFFLAFIIGKYFESKSKAYLKEEYKKNFNWSPRSQFYSYFSSSYVNKKGVNYKNISLLIPIMTIILIIVLITIFGV